MFCGAAEQSGTFVRASCNLHVFDQSYEELIPLRYIYRNIFKPTFDPAVVGFYVMFLCVEFPTNDCSCLC